MSLFILTAYYDSSTEVIGVFSSRAMAKARAKVLEKANEVAPGMWDILEAVVDNYARPKRPT